MQLQISSCTSRCQGVTQIQQATQSNSTIQQIAGAGQIVGTLTSQPASGTTSQLTSTIIQIQLGCLFQCFGTTPTDPSSAALIQLLLSQLSAFLPPSGSSRVQPAPGVQQNGVEQVAWQVQDGSPDSQLQSASQTNATVQITEIVARWPAYLGSAPAVPQLPLPQAVDQTQQQTWQLQIGCLFYCVDSQQVQQAQQSTTTIQIVEGPPGSVTTVAVVQQTIWQVQVGCLAWCWDSTQVQEANTQSTIAALTVPPPTDGPGPAPGPAPPAPGPGAPSAPGPGAPSAPGPGAPPAPESGPGAPEPGLAAGGTTSLPEPASASSNPPPTITGASRQMPAGPTAKHTRRHAPVHVLRSPGRTGFAMLAVLSAPPVSTPPRRPAPATASSTILHDETVKRPGTASMAHRLSVPPRHVVDAASPRRPLVIGTAPAIAPGPNGGSDPLLPLMLATAGILSLAAIARRRSLRHGWR